MVAIGIAGCHLLSIFIFIILYSPAIYSYLSIASEYARATPADQFTKGASQTGFSFASYLSFIYPFATTKDTAFLTDDLAMRNAYFSFGGFVIVLTQIRNGSPLIRSLLITSLIMLLLSAGGFVKTVLYSHLPFLNYIRTNGEFRVLAILCFSVVAGFGLTYIEFKRNESVVLFRKILKILAVAGIAIFCFVATQSFPTAISLLHHTGTINGGKGVKELIDNLTFNHVFLISIIINLGIIIILLAVKTNVKKVAVIVIIDLVLNSIMYLPFSGIGVVTLSEVQQTYNKSPKGITIPPMVKIKEIDTLPTKVTGLVGSWAFYNKKIGITRLQDYPSYFSNTESYFNSSLPRHVNNHRYVFFKTDFDSLPSTNYDSYKSIIVSHFSPQKIMLNITSPADDSLIILQNFYKFWKVKVDGNVTEVNRSLITFMSVPVNKGVHSIEFIYEDKLLYLFISISVLAFIFLLFFAYINRRTLSNENKVNN